VSFIPVSALLGDNVVEPSANMGWFRGVPLLQHLEDVHIASDRNLIDVRFPVQYVIRPHSAAHHDYRGYAGTVAGGVIKPGDEVVVLPSGLKTSIAHIDTYDGPVTEAFAGMSVIVRLTDDLDVSRGDMICRPGNHPTVGQDVEAMVCWLNHRPMAPGGKYAIKHTTRWCRGVVCDLRYRLDINTLHSDETATSLGLNEIGRVGLRMTAPLFYDGYRRNRTTGSFILVDEGTDATVGAGMILGSGD
ncbi:MAG: elongation factor 1-alpha C-terminal domain-related protein, partial [Acidimicrobiales bacterium]